MILHIADVASYQGALSTAAVKAAGFGAVNLKISHGLTRKSVHPDVTGWIDRARQLGLGISTFHYLTADATGEAQAEFAYAQLASLGLLYGTAHQVDVESSPAPTQANVRAYLTRMTELLGRPVALYTGDWWWQPKGWNVSDLAPYLWSASNAGYLTAYPGDTSPHWAAGYGGWPVLSVMQYAVQPIAGIKVSMSAVRDPAVWTALTQGRTGMSYAPQTLEDARALWLDTFPTMDPLSMGIVGDDSHAKSGTSYHLGEDALQDDAYSIVESSRDRNGLTDAASALDIGWWSRTINGKTHNLRTFSVWWVAQCKANTADTRDVREIIYSPDGKVVKRWDRLGVRTTGASSHLTHTHGSYFRDSEKRDKTALFRRYFIEIGLLEEPPMAIDDADVQKIVKAVWGFDPGDNQTGATNGGMAMPGWSKPGDNATANPAYGVSRAVVGTDVAYQIRDRVDSLAVALAKVLANVTADDSELQALQAAIAEAQEATVRDVLAGLGGSGQSDEQIAEALKAALGDRAQSVGQLLTA